MTNAKIRVLIIDDDETDRYTYSRYLKLISPDYEVYEAEDGKVGLMLARSIKPDCVLLDLRLQEESGYEVLHALAGDQLPPKIPVLMLSALAGDALKQGALGLNAVGYLVKGKTDATTLHQAVQQAIGRQSRPYETV